MTALLEEYFRVHGCYLRAPFKFAAREI